MRMHTPQISIPRESRLFCSFSDYIVVNSLQDGIGAMQPISKYSRVVPT